MNTDAIILTIIFFVLEICDIYLNPANNMLNLIDNYLRRFHERPIIFFLSHFGFIFLSFCLFALSIESIGLAILWALYGFDIIYKLSIYSKFRRGEFNALWIDQMRATPIRPAVRVGISYAICIIFFLCIS